MRQGIIQVDAFTATPFAGNPAAVCVLTEEHDEVWMQNVAREMNLSETAFLERREDGFQLRWFTPTIEVNLCGHATLASAHVLWEEGYLKPTQEACFYTRSGLLSATRREQWIRLNFPATPAQETDAPDELLDALGVGATYVGKSDSDYLVEVSSEAIVNSVQPDFARLMKIPARGIIITSRATTDAYDFVSRFFAPRVGVNEDPVTGSAHCCLGPYWSKILGKSNLTGYQASPRGGVVRVQVENERVYLEGQAITVLRGELII